MKLCPRSPSEGETAVSPIEPCFGFDLVHPTSWELDGETVETVSDFIFLGSTITADGDGSHEIKEAYSLEGTL